ncbi:MAG: hypothetical protein QMA99_09500, partial [Flavobacterium sp.]
TLQSTLVQSIIASPHSLELGEYHTIILNYSDNFFDLMSEIKLVYKGKKNSLTSSEFLYSYFN